MTYLGSLSMRLAAGALQLDADFRERHMVYVRSKESPTGGFVGRQGDADLYYTSFALRGLALLGGLDRSTIHRTAQFLAAWLPRREDISCIDFLSLVMGARLVQNAGGPDIFSEADLSLPKVVAARLAPLCSPEGGYRKSCEGSQTSTYFTFLAMLCHELAGETPPNDPSELADWVLQRRRDEGGFVEMNFLRHSGTNPTAAAVAILRMADAMEPDVQTAAREFLVGMQSPEGGFAANTRIPQADLLSTFTALVALTDLDAPQDADLNGVHHFAKSLESLDGGFRSGPWDEEVDVEYTFYGVGTTAMLASLGVG